ncbi:MAG: hypothetical protein ABI811_20820 [Acidobacteriota bacterium]
MRLNYFVARLYPKWWRDRYGEEFAALLEDARPGLAGTFDICKGALAMQLTNWSPKRILACGALAGLAIAGVATLFLTPMYRSLAILHVASGSGDKEILARVNSISNTVLGKDELRDLIRKLNLYPEERKRMTTEQLIEYMRNEVTVAPLDNFEGGKKVPAFKVQFAYPDRVIAQRTVWALVTQYIDQDVKLRDKDAYLAGELRPEGGIGLELLATASLPEEPTYPGRNKILFSGLAGGTLIGGLFALIFRLRKAPPKQ